MEWLLKGEGPPPAREAMPLREHAPEGYQARPAELNVDRLAKVIVLALAALKKGRASLGPRGQAKLIALLYEYWQDNQEPPDDLVVKAYLPQARRADKEEES